jgi:hypothetical protein
MQAAMIAYRLMIGGPYEADWQALAAAETPQMRTIDYFCKRQLLAWRLNFAPSLDPSFPGGTIPAQPAALNLRIPYQSHGVISVSWSNDPAPTDDSIALIACSPYHPPNSTSTVMLAYKQPLTTDELNAGIRILPGSWVVTIIPMFLNGAPIDECNSIFDGPVIVP